jgi:hypothetical protein
MIVYLRSELTELRSSNTKLAIELSEVKVRLETQNTLVAML